MKRLAIMFVAVAALMAACGGTSADVSNDSAATQTTEQPEQVESATTTTAEAGDEASSSEFDLGEDGELSLDDFMPGARAFDENTDFRAQEMEIQTSIAACMAAEGFDYIPFVPSDVGGGFGFDEYDHEEYVKTYGFGIATWVLEEAQWAESQAEGEDPWGDDPNQEIVDAMDEFERDEYYRVLHGGEPPIIENTPWEELEAMSDEERDAFYQEAYEGWEHNGCWNQASEEIYGGGEADMAFWEEFGEEFESIYMRAESDPRIVEAQAGWSACMAESGHDYATQEDMYFYLWGGESGGTYVEGEFQQKVNEVVTWPEPFYEDGSEDEGGGIVETTIAITGGEGDEGFEYVGPEYDMEKLQPLIDEEISIATADFDCSEDMWELFEVVYKEAEQEFIDSNLDRLMAFHEQHG